ncbi:uncharacterized protein LOC103717554 isoform X2 [Phoenix dactylifera]|uniref:Uncharacterized protein LOC103717554 isoform X2 n=1 Tax=Phoenix dactylifera TaxID=42345 RepID=A0A8B9AT92_PHODC|nr:uncharacterized protein LOC103717554 isoform X2 [Phoenix dactylifera]
MPKKYSIKSGIPLLVPCLHLRALDFFLRLWPPAGTMGADLSAERTTLVSSFRRVRWVSLFLGIWNLGVVLLGGFLLLSVVSGCSGEEKLPFSVVSLVAGVRIVAMVGAGKAQQETAETIVNHPIESSIAVDAVIRHERRMRYKRWLWWTRFGMAVTVLQFVGAVYLMYIIFSDFSFKGGSKSCFLDQDKTSRAWKRFLVVSFLVLVWLVVIIQCFTGSDILRWRSFYATHDTAWKAHYREVFDHGIREALCCLGRVKYLSVLEEDEVSSVARLLGDLVAYRASGTGHLELLTGLALLQMHKQSPKLYDELIEASDELIQEAAVLHLFAEAAYTGPLLDFGRNPILFPCAWLYRQGVLTPWTRSRRPALEGDNWWRGHAAAFLKYVNLNPEALRQGRVSQTKREAAYFVVVLHDQRSIVIAVRGTETPEDLITDGLCRECALTMEDLDGLLNSEHVRPSVRQRVLSSFPHYGHAGIVESARELFMQIDGHPGVKDDSSSEVSGFLSSLLGVGCECHGYQVRIVGHSLGGAVATLLGLRLYRRYPNLHVYAYGSLPCVDLALAEACSDFVTTIVYNDEFSARLSVNSILRLRASAIKALSDNSSADSAMIQKLACRILRLNKYHENGEHFDASSPSYRPSTMRVEESKSIYKRRPFRPTIEGSSQPDQELHDPHQEEASLFANSGSEILKFGGNEYTNYDVIIDGLNECNFREPCLEKSDVILSCEDQTSRFLEDPTSVPVSLEPPEVFLPGFIIHIVREPRSIMPLWKNWIVHDHKPVYRAFVAKRERFRDIIVTPSMFIDHLPWRCHSSMQRVLEARKSQGQLTASAVSRFFTVHNHTAAKFGHGTRLQSK